jgi:hypothetical protein
MTDTEKRELAEKHWIYTLGLLKACNIMPTPLDHYLYVESFCHGWKHGENVK